MMANRRKNYHHGDLKRALVDEAFASIERDGVDKFSVRGAARGADVDVAAVYRHFESKEGLLQAVALNAFAQLARKMESEQEHAATSADKIHAIARAYVRYAVDHPKIFRTAFGVHGAVGPADPDCNVDEGNRNPFEILLDGLSALKADGEVAGAVDRAALSVWAAVHGLAHLAVEGNVETNIALNGVADVVQTTLRGLAGTE